VSKMEGKTNFFRGAYRLSGSGFGEKKITELSIYPVTVSVFGNYWRPSQCLAEFRNIVAWAEPDPKQHFSRFRVPFGYPAHSLQETVLPQTNGTDGKPRLWTLKLCLLLVQRVCDQAFGRFSIFMMVAWPLKICI